MKSNLVIERKDMKLEEYIKIFVCLQWFVFGLAEYWYYN